MSSAPQLPERYIRSIYRFKAIALCVIFAVYSLIEAFVSPFGPWVAISSTVIAALVPAAAIVALPVSVPQWLIRLSLYIDAVALTAGIHLGGGVDNVSMPLLYTTIISLAALLLTRTDTVMVTACSILLYDAMVLAEHTGVLAHLVPYSRPPARQLSTVIPVNLFLLLLAWLGLYAMEQIRTMYRRIEEGRQEAVHALSHDLKNPLAVIHDYADLLPTAEAEERAAFGSAIQRAAQQALDLVSNVLDAAAFEGRPVTPGLVPVQLNDLVREAMQRYESAAQARHITLRSELQSTFPVMRVDPQLITRAISNLLSNAIKYGGPGGTVCVSTAAANGTALISVCDGGPGIPAAEQPLLFRRYSRTSSARGIEGSGLGLYIVRCIAEAHQGSVRLSSAPGKGCRFTLTLPLAVA